MPINSVTLPLKSTYTSGFGIFPLFYFIHFTSNLKLILFLVNWTLSMIFVYSLNLFLYLYLAINSPHWFNNFSGSGYIIICIFFLLGTDYIYYQSILEYSTFSIWSIESQGSNIYSSNSKIAKIGLFGFSDVHGRKKKIWL